MTGFQHLIVPASHFRLLSGADDLNEYLFNTGIAIAKPRRPRSRICPQTQPDRARGGLRPDPGLTRLRHFS